MAVGDYVFDDMQPPPILAKALNYERWGIGDVMQLPAGLLPRINTVLSYYHAMQGYRQSSRATEWAKRNQSAWDMVSWYLAQRMEQKRGDRNQ